MIGARQQYVADFMGERVPLAAILGDDDRFRLLRRERLAERLTAIAMGQSRHVISVPPPPLQQLQPAPWPPVSRARTPETLATGDP
jgi:hypothetical protein